MKVQQCSVQCLTKFIMQFSTNFLLIIEFITFPDKYLEQSNSFDMRFRFCIDFTITILKDRALILKIIEKRLNKFDMEVNRPLK